MSSKKASFSQIKALHVAFERAHSESRVPGIDYTQELGDYDTERKTWASAQMGQLVGSFTSLTAWQAGFLLDILNGKRPRLFTELDELCEKALIFDRDAWVRKVLPHWHPEGLIGSPRPFQYDTINAREALHLRQVLKNRRGR